MATNVGNYVILNLRGDWYVAQEKCDIDLDVKGVRISCDDGFGCFHTDAKATRVEIV